MQSFWKANAVHRHHRECKNDSYYLPSDIWCTTVTCFLRSCGSECTSLCIHQPAPLLWCCTGSVFSFLLPTPSRNKSLMAFSGRLQEGGKLLVCPCCWGGWWCVVAMDQAGKAIDCMGCGSLTIWWPAKPWGDPWLLVKALIDTFNQQLMSWRRYSSVIYYLYQTKQRWGGLSSSGFRRRMRVIVGHLHRAWRPTHHVTLKAF